MVEGGTIDIEATSGDQPLVQTLANGLTDETSTDQFASWGPWVNSALDSVLQASNLLPGLNVATLPVSINYRDAASTVTVGQYTQILAAATSRWRPRARPTPRGKRSTRGARSSARRWRS